MLVAGSAAAALVLLVGVGEVTGVVHVHFGNNGTATVLTAVTGCSQIEQADGTLEQVHGSSLVIKTASGQPVTTSGDTLVVIPHASPGRLQAGATIFALGHAGPDGTLAARAVAAISQVPSGAHIGASVKVKDCSPSSIDEAMGAISAAPGSAG